jgi:hypothetical protein
VGTGVREVFALQVDPPPHPLGEAARNVPRGRPADEVAEQGIELAAKRLVLARLTPSGGQLVEGGDQDLGDESAP